MKAPLVIVALVAIAACDQDRPTAPIVVKTLASTSAITADPDIVYRSARHTVTIRGKGVCVDGELRWHLSEREHARVHQREDQSDSIAALNSKAAVLLSRARKSKRARHASLTWEAGQPNSLASLGRWSGALAMPRWQGIGTTCASTPQECLDIGLNIFNETKQWKEEKAHHDAFFTEFLSDLATGAYHDALVDFFGEWAELPTDIPFGQILSFFDDVIDAKEVGDIALLMTHLEANCVAFGLAGGWEYWECVQFDDEEAYGWCDPVWAGYYETKRQARRPSRIEGRVS